MTLVLRSHAVVDQNHVIIPILNRFSSFPRMRESRQPLKNWIPAFAGMTNSVVFDLKKIKPIGKRYYSASS